MSGNSLLLETEIFPDYGVIILEDVGTLDFPDGPFDEVLVSDHQISVRTLPTDQAVAMGKNVHVKVFKGEESTGLGKIVFDGKLTFTNPILGVGQMLSDPEELETIPLDRSGPVHLQIFVTPPTSATEVNILIRYDLS
ncbi:hypothetical protein [Mycobacteroides salmoniphilum]|uniref:hypothetical protein n=1 Tax=Mycobacteroides salmoniphilum TaxID=404941 RepID=UPI00106707BB|nr:hypothetical protein [Mycobacteroides salmoniphilum]TDZ81721.1 hypothetical protein DE4586_01681 [Mycobacteroides salmoniphilum]TDZ89221.1 hypothetical protein DE4587_01597 [Mycobacteroides salmoniphilum]